MKEKTRVIHYINQFFAGIGGEEKAEIPLETREGATGPGTALERCSPGKLDVIQTIICGDNFFHSNIEEVLTSVIRLVQEVSPDVLVAGPAFNAGRYGLACRAVCERVSRETGVPTVTAMYKDNPALNTKPILTYILPCSENVRGMGDVLPRLADFAYRLGAGAEIGNPEREGYYLRGVRKNIAEEQSSAIRAVAMLKNKLLGEKYVTEIPLPSFDIMTSPAPIPDLTKATIALVTDGGLVTLGNQDRLETNRATKWLSYSIAGTDSLEAQYYESIHGGFDIRAVNADPDRLVPVDAMRELEREGKIGKLYEYFYTTSGNGTPVKDCIRMGKEMAASLASEGVDGVILTGT